MSAAFPRVYLARHGETAWSLSRQHTGSTDLPLTENGERQAQQLGSRLKTMTFDRVFVSPLQRARRTCEIAGFGPTATVDADLTEWRYGRYEGKTTDEIQREHPGWNVFRDGTADGERPSEVSARADRVIGHLRALQGTTLLFSSAHFLRALTARWLDLSVAAGACFALDTASLCLLGYEHSLNDPVIRLWNDPPVRAA